MFHFPFTSTPFVGSFIFVIIKRCDFLFPLSLWLQMVRFLGVVNMTWRRTCQDILFLLFRIKSLFFSCSSGGSSNVEHERKISSVNAYVWSPKALPLSPHTQATVSAKWPQQPGNRDNAPQWQLRDRDRSRCTAVAQMLASMSAFDAAVSLFEFQALSFN